MQATGLWYPIYDRHLAWVGVRLETDPSAALPTDFLEKIRKDIQSIEGFAGKILFLDAYILQALTGPLESFLPPIQLAIILNDNFLSSPNNVANCLAWHKQKARLAVHGLDFPAQLPADTISLRILNAASARVSYNEKALLNAARSTTRIFAQGIGSIPLFKWGADLGFSYFTFAGLDCLPNENKSQSPSSLPIMQLLALVARDANISEIEEIFKRDPKLAFELLKLVNSAAFGIRKEITNFAQAVMILGQRQLQRWLQLLMYAQHNKGNNMPNILMQRAAERGRLMELLAAHGNEQVDTEQAFMVGVFSVLDVLMSSPLKELLRSIALPQPVEKALLERSGRLGTLLTLICATENSALTTVRRLCIELEISSEILSHCQLDAIFWALKISRSK